MVNKSVVDDGLTLKISHMMEGYTTNLQQKDFTVVSYMAQKWAEKVSKVLTSSAHK